MDINTKHTLGLAHGILMVFVWVVAVPIAVAVPMYAKKKQKTWGAKVHMSIMATAAFLPFTVSAIMAFVASGSLKLRPHSTLGTIITFGAWMQVILGIVNHSVFRYRRKHNCVPKTRPWNNSIHIWLGRILMLTALINIPLGMRIKKAGTGFYVAYGVWIAILAVMFTVLVWMKPENKQIADGKDITTIMDETESDAEEVIDTKE